MNKTLFRLLVFLMSLSLIGIILVQLYLINTSLKNNEEQFKYHVKQVIANVSDHLEQQETYSFLNEYNKLKDSIGKDPKQSEMLDFILVQKNRVTNQTVIYSNSIIADDYGLTFFDKKRDSVRAKNFISKSKTEIFSGDAIDKSTMQHNVTPDITIQKSGSIELLDKAQFEIFFKDIAETKAIKDRVSAETLNKLLEHELKQADVITPFQFAVYENGLATKIKSDKFKVNKNATFMTPIFKDNQGNSRYKLLVSFPEKKKFLFSELINITILSIVFTLVIIIAYSSALSQLIKQRQISEIKTDFINNMTHEFKTPIATINLALDAIKNPKVQGDYEKMHRYHQMIRDENKRMHAQVENVLRISKLEKRELEINKESYDINEIIEDAAEHVNLIIEDRGGIINMDLQAKRTTVLLNDVHFTNVIVNILDNAIKYSPDAPIINVHTENVKDFVIIKIKDKGSGMSKTAQKRIFEKFYREHTGDIHNVKGHGLGLAYVKKIIEDHDGQIAVESEKGKGSTFIIKLPLIN
ncbi:MAG: two-component sensor histidine kinase [Flavobacterium sp. BFFFF1]|uniref:sensor histidine kinase n=1 Tax=unclassified Flavobacterium TaxID=196869 RepID=UPI000BDDD8C9|nr:MULTISPECIES: HAMP domain-containing sensor histidine kinase [unclassified Flavobacterium]OYU80361.1 MAG: two-component sensor histidine kinase [Flavobacterium sp. BFFFF1]